MNFFFKENFKPPQSFKCKSQNIFLNLSNVCNEIVDCKYGDDELYCFNFSSMNCPFGCNCQFPLYIKCHPFISTTSELFIDFPIKGLVINKTDSVPSINFQYNLMIVYLRIEYSQITELMNFNTPNLVKLILRNNRIKSFDNFNDVKWIYLQYFDLSANLISYIPDNYLLNFPNLYYLDLSFNKIKQINDKIFSSLNQLIYLKLANLNLNSLHKNSFKNLKNLENLYLNNTKLYILLDKTLLKQLKNLKYLYSNSYFLCCMTENFDFNMTECKLNSSIIKSCKKIIKNIYVETSIWMLILLNFTTNIFAVYKRKGKFLPEKIFSIGLNIFNLIICLTFLIIIIIGKIYKNKFIEKNESFKFNNSCLLFAFIFQICFLSYDLCLLFINLRQYLLFYHENFIIKRFKSFKENLIIFISSFTLSTLFSFVYFLLQVFKFYLYLQLFFFFNLLF